MSGIVRPEIAHVFQGEDNAAAPESAGFQSAAMSFKVLNFLDCSIIKSDTLEKF